MNKNETPNLMDALYRAIDNVRGPGASDYLRNQPASYPPVDEDDSRFEPDPYEPVDDFAADAAAADEVYYD